MPIELIDLTKKFFELETRTTFWGILNAPFTVTVLLGAIGLWLQRRFSNEAVLVNSMNRATDALAKRLDDIRPEIEPEIQETPLKNEDFRTDAKSEVRELKSKIDQLVAADTDKRHHRVYARLGKYDYKVLAEALYERGMMYDLSLHQVLAALSVWDAYAKGRAAHKPVPKGVLNLLRKANSKLNDDISDYT